MKRFIIAFLIGSITPCYAEVLREDIVSYNLDYYSIKTKETKQAAAQEKIKQEKIEIMQEEKEKVSEERTEKINKFMKAVIKDIRVSIALEQVYNDNLYRTHTNQESGFITHPNINLSYRPRQGVTWKAGHTAISADLSGGPGLRTTNTNAVEWIGGTPTFVFDTALTHKRGKFTIKGDYGYERHASPLSDIITNDYLASHDIEPGEVFDATGGYADLNKSVYFWRKPYGAKIAADWNRIPTEFIYNHIGDYYPEEHKGSNVLTDKFNLTNYFNLSRKTQLLFSYEYQRDKYPYRLNDDSSQSTYSTGIKGKISPKLRGLAQGGYTVRNTKDQGQNATYTTKVNLEYKLSNALMASLSVNRQYDTTAYADQSYVKILGTKLGMLYQPYFNKKLRFGSTLGLTQYNYSTQRSDSLSEASFYCQYAWRKWLKFIGEYNYAYRMSDDDVYEYKNNIISLKLVSEF